MQVTVYLKRFGEELQTKTPKRLKEDKDDEAKDDEPTKMFGKRRKQIARKGMHTSVDENISDDSDKVDEQEETNTEGFWKCLRIMFEEPLSTDSIWSEIEQQKIVCKTMLKMKLLDGKMNEDCYRLLKMMEKQAGIRK
ncbi:hypothetical protein Tco_0176217 [Tanacetum coccineum]